MQRVGTGQSRQIAEAEAARESAFHPGTSSVFRPGHYPCGHVVRPQGITGTDRGALEPGAARKRLHRITRNDRRVHKGGSSVTRRKERGVARRLTRRLNRAGVCGGETGAEPGRCARKRSKGAIAGRQWSNDERVPTVTGRDEDRFGVVGTSGRAVGDSGARERARRVETLWHRKYRPG